MLNLVLPAICRRWSLSRTAAAAPRRRRPPRPPQSRTRPSRICREGNLDRRYCGLTLNWIHFQVKVQGDSGGRVPWLGWLRFGEFPPLEAITVATFCSSRMVEYPKSNSTQPRYSATRVPLYHGGQTLHFVDFMPNCYAIADHFATTRAESGRQWNNQIEINVTQSLTTMVTLYITFYTEVSPTSSSRTAEPSPEC